MRQRNGYLLSDRLYRELTRAPGRPEITMLAAITYLYTGDASLWSRLPDCTVAALPGVFARLVKMRERRLKHEGLI